MLNEHCSMNFIAFIYSRNYCLYTPELITFILQNLLPLFSRIHCVYPRRFLVEESWISESILFFLISVCRISVPLKISPEDFLFFKIQKQIKMLHGSVSLEIFNQKKI